MRILVIGGTGFIGPHVVRSLAAMGHKVIVFHRGHTEAQLPLAVRHLHHPSVLPGDRRHFADFAGEFRQLAPEVVLDMIPCTEQDARALMSTFRGVARRAIAISSQDVYRAYDRVHGGLLVGGRVVVMREKDRSPADPVPLSEDTPLRPRLYPARGDIPRAPDDPSRWLDDYEKILVERIVMSDPELSGTVLRLPAVYGPGDGQHRLFGYLKRMDDHRPVILLAEGQARWRWSRGYMENVAAAITRAVIDERAAGRIYNVAEPEALPEADWVRQIGGAAGWQGEVAEVPQDRLPSHLRHEANWDQHWTVDTTRIRQELDYVEPVAQEEALRRTVEWEQAHPPEKIDPFAFDYAAEDVVLAEFSGHEE